MFFLCDLGCFFFLFKTLTSVEVTQIETPFTEDEVKMKIRACDIFKSPCLDDINFGFIKDL